MLRPGSWRVKNAPASCQDSHQSRFRGGLRMYNARLSRRRGSRRPYPRFSLHSAETEDDMRSQARWFVGFALALVGVSGTLVRSQGRGGQAQESPYLAPPAQVVAVRAGRLFDAKAGTMSANVIVLIRGDRITDAGPSVQIPPDARVIDLG